MQFLIFTYRCRKVLLIITELFSTFLSWVSNPIHSFHNVPGQPLQSYIGICLWPPLNIIHHCLLFTWWFSTATPILKVMMIREILRTLMSLLDLYRVERRYHSKRLPLCWNLVTFWIVMFDSLHNLLKIIKIFLIK